MQKKARLRIGVITCSPSAPYSTRMGVLSEKLLGHIGVLPPTLSSYAFFGQDHTSSIGTDKGQDNHVGREYGDETV